MSALSSSPPRKQVCFIDAVFLLDGKNSSTINYCSLTAASQINNAMQNISPLHLQVIQAVTLGQELFKRSVTHAALAPMTSTITQKIPHDLIMF